MVEAYVKEKPELAIKSLQFAPLWPGDRIECSALGWAAIHGHVDLCRFLLTQPIDPKDKAFPYTWTNPKIVEVLLTTKTDPDIVTPNLREAVRKTCRHGTVATLRVYIKHGVFDGRKGVPQVSWDQAFVAAAGAWKLADFKTEHIANVKALYEVKPNRDIKETLAKALYECVVRNHIGVLTFLLEQKAPTSYRWIPKIETIGADDSRYPIHMAARNGSIEATKLLLEAGATINDKDGDGRTPLDYAVREDRVALVEWLIRVQNCATIRD